MAKLISDTCFLLGIPFLIVGMVKLARKSGFFYLPLHGLKQFVSVLANSRRSRDDSVAGYLAYREKARGDTSYGMPLAIGIASLGIALASALFCS